MSSPQSSPDRDIVDAVGASSVGDVTPSTVIAALTFGLHSLCAQKPGGSFRVVGFYTDGEELLDRAVELTAEGFNVWRGVNPLDHEPKSGRGGAADVESVHAVYADLDWHDDTAHKGTDLATEAELRTRLAPLLDLLSVVVNSGHGLQVYALLDRPVDAETGRRLQARFDEILAAHGLANDRHDLASVLRVPGSINLKSDPIEVVVERFDPDQRIDVDDVLARLDDKPDEKPDEKPTEDPYASVWSPSVTESPGDRYDRETSIVDELERHGFIFDRELAAHELSYTRPGKSGGTSVHVHTDTNLAHVYTSSVPGLDQDKSYGPFRLMARLDFGGDESRAARAILAAERTTSTIPSNVNAETGEIVRSVNLPDEFWTARPVLEQIRSAAHSRNRSADALLGSILARVSILVPPSWLLPPIVGTPSPPNLFVAIIAASGGGKSSGAGVGADLLPIDKKRTLLDVPIGSGEGIGAAFLDNVIDETTKKKELRQVQDAVLYYVDEGEAIAAIGVRNGSTLLPSLRRGWSGGVLGEYNANPERRRIVEAGKYRLALVAAFQPSSAAALLDDAAGGTPQRFLWLSASDPSIPDEPPQWPGTIDFREIVRLLPVVPTGSFFDYHPEIISEIRTTDLARARGVLVVDPLDGHAGLLRLRVAVLLAVLDLRTVVSVADYELAGIVLDTSSQVRSTVLAAARDEAAEREHASTSKAIRREEALDSSKERRAFDAAIRAVAGKCHREKTGLGRTELRRATRGSDRALVGDFDAVLEEAEARGLIRREGDAWVAGGTKP